MRRHPSLPSLSRAAIAAALLVCAAAHGTAQDEPEYFHRIVPLTYDVTATAAAPVIDGRLDDDAWRDAPWSADFVDIEGELKPAPRFRTRVKMLWDAAYFYFGAELEEPHVCATLLQRDTVIFRDNDFEIFLDPDGDTRAYYEFEMNAYNTVWDLFLDKPYRESGKADNGWDIAGLRSAVHVNGTINDPSDIDRGWTLEVAIPWSAFDRHGLPAVAPRPGDVWRVNFSRVQWRYDIRGGRYVKIEGLAEDNWTWSPQGVINMHRPEKWGVVRFTSRPGR